MKDQLADWDFVQVGREGYLNNMERVMTAFFFFSFGVKSDDCL